MASLKGGQQQQQQIVGESISEPESLDLDYDMWQGQFEIIGQTSTSDKKSESSSDQDQNGDDSNLNLVFQQFDPSKTPILIDEETFLSLHPNDFLDNDDSFTDRDGPHSGLFIENLEGFDSNLKKCKKIDNFFNSNLQKQKIFLMNSKNANDSEKNSLITDNNTSDRNNNCVDEIAVTKDNHNASVKEKIAAYNNGGNSNGRLPPSNKQDTLNEQFELLQRQVSTLAATQNTNEDVTTRTKTEYAVLQARYYMLEEQLRECELRGEQRLMEEQKNHKELLARAERESELQAENYQIKLKTTEKESNQLREEVQRLRILCDKQASDLHMTEEKLEITQDNYQALQQELDEVKAVERKLLAEKTVHEELMIELDKEMERMRAERGPALPTTSPESIRLEELHQELDELRQTNRNLSETNEELQALVLTRGVEEGINLLNGTSNSLAQELHDMSQSQDSVDSTVLSSLTQLQSAFKDKEEENIRLKHYIDTILLNIVENYPQLLEVKSNSTTSSPKAMNISH